MPVKLGLAVSPVSSPILHTVYYSQFFFFLQYTFGNMYNVVLPNATFLVYRYTMHIRIHPMILPIISSYEASFLCRLDTIDATSTVHTAAMIAFCPHPYRVRSENDGFWSGLKTRPRRVFLTASR